MSAALRLLCVAPSYLPFIGGAQTFLAEMARRLAADGHAVTILTTTARRPTDFWQPPKPHQSPAPPEREEAQGVTIRRLLLAYPWPAPYAFGVARRLGHLLVRSGLPLAAQMPVQRALARHMPPLPGLSAALEELIPQHDVVLALDASWDGLFTAALEAAARAGLATVAVPLKHLGSPSVRAHFNMAHQRRAYMQADAVVALSSIEARAFQALGVAPERLHVLSMGVEPAPPPVPVEFVAEFVQGGGGAEPVIAFVGANTYDKGAWHLALAVARLREQGVPARLVCVGPQREALERAIARQSAPRRAALQAAVRCLGLVSEARKHALLEACAALALPSQVDTFGIALLEAWQHARPVVAARAGGLPDLVREGGNGLLVPFGDVPALAEALARLLADPELAARLGEQGRADVLQRYTWDRTYGEMGKLFTRVAMNHVRRQR
jgi:glycosyltransferase involved in cell wall biosynthesis